MSRENNIARINEAFGELLLYAAAASELAIWRDRRLPAYMREKSGFAGELKPEGFRDIKFGAYLGAIKAISDEENGNFRTDKDFGELLFTTMHSRIFSRSITDFVKNKTGKSLVKPLEHQIEGYLAHGGKLFPGEACFLEKIYEGRHKEPIQVLKCDADYAEFANFLENICAGVKKYFLDEPLVREFYAGTCRDMILAGEIRGLNDSLRLFSNDAIREMLEKIGAADLLEEKPLREQSPQEIAHRLEILAAMLMERYGVEDGEREGCKPHKYRDNGAARPSAVCGPGVMGAVMSFGNLKSAAVNRYHAGPEFVVKRLLNMADRIADLQDFAEVWTAYSGTSMLDYAKGAGNLREARGLLHDLAKQGYDVAKADEFLAELGYGIQNTRMRESGMREGRA